MSSDSKLNVIRIQKTIRGFIARKRLLGMNKKYSDSQKRKIMNNCDKNLNKFDCYQIVDDLGNDNIK